MRVVIVWWLYHSSQQAIFEEGNRGYSDFSEVCCVYWHQWWCPGQCIYVMHVYLLILQCVKWNTPQCWLTQNCRNEYILCASWHYNLWMEAYWTQNCCESVPRGKAFWGISSRHKTANWQCLLSSPVTFWPWHYSRPCRLAKLMKPASSLGGKGGVSQLRKRFIGRWPPFSPKERLIRLNCIWVCMPACALGCRGLACVL